MKKSIGAMTIIFPTSVLIVGTYDVFGKPNLMAAAWGGICCSRPPCVAISLRKATYTYGNIVEKNAFTINILSETHVKEADYYGIATGKDVDKFAATGITPVKSEIVDAPCLDEACKGKEWRGYDFIEALELYCILQSYGGSVK